MQLRLKHRFEFFVQRKTHQSTNDAHTHIHASIRLSVCWSFLRSLFLLAFYASVRDVVTSSLACLHIRFVPAALVIISCMCFYFIYVAVFLAIFGIRTTKNKPSDNLPNSFLCVFCCCCVLQKLQFTHYVLIFSLTLVHPFRIGSSSFWFCRLHCYCNTYENNVYFVVQSTNRRSIKNREYMAGECDAVDEEENDEKNEWKEQKILREKQTIFCVFLLLLRLSFFIYVWCRPTHVCQSGGSSSSSDGGDVAITCQRRVWESVWCVLSVYGPMQLCVV